MNKQTVSLPMNLVSSHPPSELGIFLLSTVGQADRNKPMSLSSFISLIDGKDKHFFIHLIVIHILSSINCLFVSLIFIVFLVIFFY